MHCSQAEQLLNLIKHDFFSKFTAPTEKQDACSEQDDVQHKADTTDAVVGESNITSSENGMDNSKKAEEADAGVDSTKEVSDDSAGIKPPICLDWYPGQLAWQLEYSRVSIRSNTTLKKLHSFLVSEMESVSHCFLIAR